MNINYYANFFSFRLPIYMVVCLLLACSKLDNRYHNRYDFKKRKASISNVEGPSSKRSKDDITLKLFKAIKKSSINQVKELLEDGFFNGAGIVNLSKIDSGGNTCLHIAAGINKGDKDAGAIMKLLLDKMRPLLLSKKNIDACEVKKTLSDFLKSWKNSGDDIKTENKKVQKERSYINSELLRKNHANETPLMVAMKYGNLSVLKCLLQTTHKCVGLQFTCRTNNTNKKNLDFLDIALNIAIESKDDSRLDLVLNEFKKCLTKSYGHFSDIKCKAEEKTVSFFTSKSRYFRRLMQQRDQTLFWKLLKKVSSVLEFSDFLYFFCQLYTNDNKFHSKSLLLTQGFLIADYFKMEFSKYLVERLNQNQAIAPEIIKFMKKIKDTSEGWLQAIVVAQRDLLRKNSHTGEQDIHSTDSISNNYEQEIQLLIDTFNNGWLNEFAQKVTKSMLSDKFKPDLE